MSNVVVENRGFFSRMKNAIVGIFIGILAVPGSIILMGWNEYRTIHRTRGLNEGAATVETIANPDTVDPQLDQKLIHMTAFANTEETLRDNDFHVEANAIKLSREVETFQWIEEEETRTRNKVGGGEERVTTYSYYKDWKSGHENSSQFHDPSHQNPQPRFGEQTWSAQSVSVGAYQLDEHLKSQVNSFENLPWQPEWIAKLDPELKDQVKLEDTHLYWSAHGTAGISSPSVGDQRIAMSVVKPTDVSFVAMQKGNTFDRFEVSNGEKLHRLYVGKFSAEEVFEKLQNENQMWAWILRFGGFVLCAIGFGLILGPINVLANVIPFFGKLTSGLTMLISLLMALCVSAATISIAWIAVRPLIGIPMLLVSVGAAFMIFRTAKGNREAQNPYRNHGKPVYGDDQVEVVQ